MTVQPLSTRRPRRNLKLSELRLAKKLYSEAVKVDEIARQLDRNKDVLCQAIRHLDMPRRRPGQCGVRPDNRRRNEKVIEAVLLGDGYEAILRRWDITPRVLYHILAEYRQRTRMPYAVWRKNFGTTVSKIFTAVKQIGTKVT